MHAPIAAMPGGSEWLSDNGDNSFPNRGKTDKNVKKA
jgi:hypothetical protein